MRRAIAVVTFSLLAVPHLVSAQNFDAIQIRTIPVTSSIYMLQGSGGNIGLSIGDDGVMIVDDQFAPLTEKIQAAIGALTPDPVEFVINTHFHYDHSDGNENFGRAGATIVAHENARTRMLTNQTIALDNRVQEAYDENGLPKITFYRSMRFHYNDELIDVIHIGSAHTDGDAVVFFRTSNVIHTGDVFARYMLPFVDQPNGGSLDGMIDGVWTIAGLIDDQTRIIPGHGAVATRADLLAYRDMFIEIRERLRDHAAKGDTPDQVVAANPAHGYAEMNAGIERWVRAAYEEYR
jgi:glyoxylase-like metal-dependent hydrolase (beta-lactamase superfamily II)